MARIAIFRKEIKDAATATVVAAYSLPVGDKEATALAVEKLLENDRYIFPVRGSKVHFSHIHLKITELQCRRRNQTMANHSFMTAS